MIYERTIVITKELAREFDHLLREGDEDFGGAVSWEEAKRLIEEYIENH